MKALELADKKGKWTSSDCMDAAAELRRLAAVEAERDALKEQMRDVAMLLLDNDRSGIKAWAAGLVLGESSGEWSVRTVVADQQKEIDTLKAENERLTNCLKKANDQAEDFERRWYLADMELERIKALEPVAWMVFSGNLDKVPVYPPFKTKELAEVAASMIKSDTEIRTLYALGSKTHE